MEDRKRTDRQTGRERDINRETAPPLWRTGSGQTDRQRDPQRERLKQRDSPTSMEDMKRTGRQAERPTKKET